MPVRALGEHYFWSSESMINICRIDQRQHVSHDYDLTEIEHYHDFTEIVFIVNGQGVQVVEGNEYPVSSGDAFVLQGNQKHYFKDASQVEIVNVMYDDQKQGELIPDVIKQMDGYKALFILEPSYRDRHHFKNKLQLNRQELSRIEISLNAMFMEQDQKAEGFDIIINNRLQELIVILSRHYNMIEGVEARSLVRLAKVIDYIENNPDNKIYIDELAEIAHMSKRNFQRTFKKAVGLSPVQYLTQVRLQKARKLLRETNLQITDVAIMTGFTDSNYFIKCFKQSYKMTPYKFRMRFSGNNVN